MPIRSLLVLSIVTITACGDTTQTPSMDEGSPADAGETSSEDASDQPDLMATEDVTADTSAPEDVDDVDSQDGDSDTPSTINGVESGAYTITHGGLERSYLLHIPDNLAAQAPLVYVFHGYTGSAMDIMSYSDMNRVADDNGFVVCYPQGTADTYDNNFFNVGYDFHDEVDVDDVGFVRALNSHLHQQLDLNLDAVFATGMSNGGEMSYLLACEASDMVKAIAPVSGTMMKVWFDTCAPEGPIPVLEIHGTEDDVSYFDGDSLNNDGWGVYLDVPTIIAFWADNAMLDLREVSNLPNSVASDGSRVIFERRWSQVSDVEVWLYQVEQGGHDWPGAWGNMDIDSSAEIWRFFSQSLD